MLYQFSLGLLNGIEKVSAIHIALAILGYIVITIILAFLTYWTIFAKSYDEELLQIRAELRSLRFKQRINSLESLDNTLSKLDFKVSTLERKMSEEDVKYKLETLDKKLDKLLEQK